MLGASPKENGERKEQDGRKGSSHGRVLIDCESGPGMESKTRSAFNDRECTKVPFDASPLRTPERENRSWSSWCDRLRFSCDPLSFVVSVEFPLSVRPLSRVVFPFPVVVSVVSRGFALCDFSFRVGCYSRGQRISCAICL